MFSDVIKSALERELVGQTQAVNTVVRGVTRLVSGMTPRERMLCAYMFMGPTGTGKTHLIHTLSEILHGDQRRIVVDCNHLVHGNPGVALVAQLAPLFAAPHMSGDRRCPLEAAPLSIIQVEFLERAPKEVCKVLTAALETGELDLGQGWRGSLRNCLTFLTSGLCAGEILNEGPRIGFTGGQEGAEEDGEDRVSKQCYEEAEKRFGRELMARLDGFLIFHGLQENQLSEILDRRAARLDVWLGSRGLRYELKAAARDYLLEKGRRDLRLGARDLLRAHQRLVEFPLADLLVSGRIPPGGLVLVDRRQDEEHFHFTLAESPGVPAAPFVREIPVA